MFEAGVTVQQFNYIVRDRAVRAASNRLLKETGRNSKSRVSLITGLPRSEVSRISLQADGYVNTKLRQPAARRVLAAWFERSSFLSPNGEPAVLSIFGNKRSFEKLVSTHGGGIPTRAMLDELTKLNAIELVGEHYVRAKSRTPVSVGLNPEAIAALGERCSDLIQTLMKNVRRNDGPLFEATCLVQDADSDLMPIIRREISKQGASFISGTNSFLRRIGKNRSGTRSSSSSRCRVGVTVYYFENSDGCTAVPTDSRKRTHRTNLRRSGAEMTKRKTHARRKET
jgi:hypothetical protein